MASLCIFKTPRKKSRRDVLISPRGALKVFEQTTGLVKLQQVMGQSSLQVSLTYLRGLDVKQLDVSDMPSL
jgi:hypothetical protein